MKTKALLLLTALTMALGNTWAQGPNNSGTYYQSANGLKGAALKTQLGKIIHPHTNVGYDGLFKAYEKTDKRADGKVRDWYSKITNYEFSDHGGYKKEGDCYNREHTVPQSWFGSGEIKSDVVQVVPTDGYVNNRRSNFPFGEVQNATYKASGDYCRLGSCKTPGYNGTVFEVPDEIKGDMARIYFYMVTCYESRAAGWGHNVFSSSNNGFEKWALDMLLRWAKEDPVDAREVARNNAVYETQRNRNPYVDYPGLEDYIWGDKQSKAFLYDDFDKVEDTGEPIVTAQVAMPIITPDGGTYDSYVEVSFTCATDGAAIYYTTDDSQPTANSHRYTEPFRITTSSIVKAIAVKEGAESYVARAVYVIKTPDSDDDFGEGEAPSDGEIKLCDDLFSTGFGGVIDSKNQGNFKAEENGVTIEYKVGDGSNQFMNSTHLRLYPGNKLVMSVATGNISAVDFMFDSKTKSTALDVNGTPIADGHWEGSGKTLTVELGSGKHARLSAVKVTMEGGQSTGMGAVKRSLAGQRVIYNLSGQRVVNPTRGMYIVDGKKVMIE